MLFEKVYSLSTENHGLVFSSDAKALGVRDRDFTRWVKIGRMVKAGHGLYRTVHYPFSEEDAYATAVARAGKKAYLCGESVLGLLGLAPTDPRFFHVAVPCRIHRRLPGNCLVEVHRPDYVPAVRNGMPMQRPADAIASCVGRMMPERLRRAGLL